MSPEPQLNLEYPSMPSLQNALEILNIQERMLVEIPTDRAINIVVISGDPSMENSILPGGKWDEDDFYSLEQARLALDSLGPNWNFTFLSNHSTLIEDLKKVKDDGKVDLVLQFCDDGYLNNPRGEMHVVAYLEMLGIPFSGSGPKCIGMTYDKQAILKIADSIDIPTPQSFYIEDDADITCKYKFAYPVFVKPNSTDGSFGITQKSVCNNEEELKAAITMIREEFQIECPILVQEYLTGRDINVACLGYSKTGEPIFLPVTEEDYSDLPEDLPKICGFESKWDESSPYSKITTRPTTLSAEVQRSIVEHSKRLFKRLDVCDYARFDWRLDGNGNPRLLEANPNCGWCWDGHLAKTAALVGPQYDYPSVLRIIMESALWRAGIAKKKTTKVKKFVNVGSIPTAVKN